MFIWSGWGLTVPLYGILGFVVASVCHNEITPDQNFLCIAVGGLVAAGSTWIAGFYLPGRLWFIPIKYYAPIYLLAFGAAAYSALPKREASAAGPAAAQSATVSQNAPVQAQAPTAPDNSVPAPPPAVVKTEAVHVENSGGLSWKITDEKDKMTDETTRKAEAGVTLPDGVTLQASAFCDDIAIEVSLDTFRGQQSAPFAWNDDEKLSVRVRIDNGEVRSATAQEEYTNEATIVFYDAETAKSAVQDALPQGEGNANKLAGRLSGVIAEMGALRLQSIAAGTLEELAAARNVRVELPLADGSKDVVDLNPRDPSLGSVIHDCYAPMQAQRAAEKQRAAAEAAKAQAKFAADVKVAQDHIVKEAEEGRQERLAIKRNTCVPGREMVVPALTVMSSLDLWDSRHAGNIPSVWMPAGSKVTVVDENTLKLPSTTKIPENMCVVSYNGDRGQLIGALQPQSLRAR